MTTTTTTETKLSTAQRKALERMAAFMSSLLRDGYTVRQAREEAVERERAYIARPTLRALVRQGMVAQDQDGDSGAVTVPYITDQGLRAGGKEPADMYREAEDALLEAEIARREAEQAEADCKAKWMELSAAFDGITYDDWQYVTGAVPNQDLGENVRESLDSAISPFRNGGTGVTIRVEALEQIAERILEQRRHIAGLEAAEDALDGLEVTCPICDGHEDTCPACDGEGRLSQLGAAHALALQEAAEQAKAG